MDRERLRRLKENMAAKSGESGGAAVATIPNPVMQAVSVVSRADSEETHDSQPLKRPRVDKAADKGVSVAVSPPTVPASVSSAIPGLENLKITSSGKLAAVLYAISYADRMATEFAGSMDAENKSLREKIKDLQQKNAEALKVIARERDALLRRDEDISSKSKVIDGLTEELDAVKKKYSELESLLKAERLELEKCKEEIGVMERDALLNYENGYAVALKHFKHQHPDEDMSVYGVFNEIIDGRLMDPSSVKAALKPSGGGTSSTADPSKHV